MNHIMFPPSPVVTVREVECYLRFNRYRANRTIACQAIVADQTSVEYGESFMTVTVNAESLWQGGRPYGEAFPFPVIVIKNYSENAGVVDDLVNAGVITRGAYIAGTNGTVEACQLTEQWQKIATQHLVE